MKELPWHKTGDTIRLGNRDYLQPNNPSIGIHFRSDLGAVAERNQCDVHGTVFGHRRRICNSLRRRRRSAYLFDGFGTCSYSGYHQHLRELHTERLLPSFSQGHLPPRSAGRTDCWIWEWQQCRSTLDIRQLLATKALHAFTVPLAWSSLKVPPSADPLTSAKAPTSNGRGSRATSQWPSGHIMTIWDLGQPISPRSSTTASTAFSACRTRRCGCFQLLAEVPVRGTVSRSAGGSRPHTESAICSLRQTRRWPVVSEAVVQPWVRWYFYEPRCQTSRVHVAWLSV